MHLELIQSTGNIEHVSSQLIDKLYRLSLEDPEHGITSELDGTSVVQGSLQAPAAYEDAVRYLVGISAGDTKRFQDLYITIPNNNYYLRLKDPTISQYCITNYGDGVGVTRSNLTSVTWNTFFGKQGSTINKSSVTSLQDFQYFTGVTLENNNLITDFSNATEIKFPQTTIVNTSSQYPRSLISNVDNLQNIDYNGVTFVSGGGITVISGNDVITDFDESFIPSEQIDFDKIQLFRSWTKLQSIIFPEGVTKTGDTFRGNQQLKYVEFPSTIQSLGNLYEIGRDGSNSYAIAIKATTPPVAYYRPNDTTNNQGGWNWHKFPTAIYVPDNAVSTYKNVTPLAIGSGGGELQLIWCCQDIIDLIKPMSEMPSSLKAYGTITQEFIDQHMV